MVRYEDLLENPAEEIKRICDEIEIDFSTSMINFNENSSSAIKDAGKSAMWSNLKRPIISTNKGKFISGLSQTELEYVEGLCSWWMRHLGYELTCTSHKQHTKNFDELEILEAKLKSDEPFEKSAYRMLPSDERKRFEHWSKIYSDLVQP